MNTRITAETQSTQRRSREFLKKTQKTQRILERLYVLESQWLRIPI